MERSSVCLSLDLVTSTRMLQACVCCFRAKVRCDRGAPCSRCMRLERVCTPRQGRSAKPVASVLSSLSGSRQGRRRPLKEVVITAAGECQGSSHHQQSLASVAPVQQQQPASRSGNCDDVEPVVPQVPSPWEGQRASSGNSRRREDSLVPITTVGNGNGESEALRLFERGLAGLVKQEEEQGQVQADTCSYHHHHLPESKPTFTLPSREGLAPGGPPVKDEEDGEEERMKVDVLGTVCTVLQPRPLGGINPRKATAVLHSWHVTNLMLGRDTTGGLLSSMADLLGLELPGELPPLTGDEGDGDLILASLLEPLWYLGPDKAMCCVSWSAGRMAVQTSERFSSIFMSNTDMEEGIIAYAEAAHQLWAGMVLPESREDYWSYVMQAAFEDTTTPMAPVRLAVRDRFNLSSWATCRIGFHSSPSGWHSCTYIILEPVPLPQ